MAVVTGSLGGVPSFVMSERIVLSDPLTDLLVQLPYPLEKFESVLRDLAGPVVAICDSCIQTLV